jgi:hypothetical protein
LERETAVGFRGRVIALIGMLAVQGKEGERAGCGGISGMRRRPARARGRRKGRGEMEADRWGPPVGAAVKNKREGGRAVGRRGTLGWALWAEKVRMRGFVFFSFLFQTSFSNQISIQIHFKLLQTFLKYYIGFLETTQATKIMQAK